MWAPWCVSHIYGSPSPLHCSSFAPSLPHFPAPSPEIIRKSFIVNWLVLELKEQLHLSIYFKINYNNKFIRGELQTQRQIWAKCGALWSFLDNFSLLLCKYSTLVHYNYNKNLIIYQTKDTFCPQDLVGIKRELKDSEVMKLYLSGVKK